MWALQSDRMSFYMRFNCTCDGCVGCLQFECSPCQHKNRSMLALDSLIHCTRVMMLCRKACDLCSEKKTKCTGFPGPCKNCIRYEACCLFSPKLLSLPKDKRHFLAAVPVQTSQTATATTTAKDKSVSAPQDTTLVHDLCTRLRCQQCMAALLYAL